MPRRITDDGWVELERTPGPWVGSVVHIATSERGRREFWVKAADGERVIAVLPSAPHMRDVCDGMLMAAAPELLEALKLFVALKDDEELYGWGDAMRAAEAAIAKVEGG